MPETSLGDVPGWSDHSLLETARENAGTGVDSDLPHEIRFRASVTRLIRKRLAHVNDRGDPAVFFLLPSGPAGVEPAAFRAAWMLDNGLTPVEGCLWFVGPVAARGLGLVVESWTDAEIFGRATELGVGDVPAILFETRTEPPEARFYPCGLANADTYELLRLDAAEVSLQEILDVVERMHRASLVTPDAQHKRGKLWAKATKFWVSAKAEDLIEFSLREGLTGALPSCVVRAEQSQATGRLDLEVEEPRWDDPSQIVRHCILELKVLKSFRSTGTAVSVTETDNWVEDGVRQAASYRAERGARTSALCCFDMRQSFSAEACFSKVRAVAKRHRVVLRVWHIFASSKAYREHLAR